jgi:lipid A 3-O-deacylase
MKKLFGIILLVCTPLSWTQSRVEDGGHEIQLWTGGGHSVPGGTSNMSVWNAGLRYGWILTRPHGPGFLKGRFEYALDAVPAFLVFQPANTAFGAGINPLNLKWNFATRGRVVPYLELSGGTLFTNHDVPTGADRVNFTSSAALGAHFLGESRNWSVEVRYTHISNAGLGDRNSGINTVQVRLGIGKFYGSGRATKK